MLGHFLAQVRVRSDELDIPQNRFTQGSLDNIFQLIFAIIGAIAIIMLMWAGLKYILARGEPAEVAKAKNMIIFAVVGLAVAMAAFSIIGFVADRL